MGEIKGFLKYERNLPSLERPEERVKHFKEFYQVTSKAQKKEQAARCMDCGVPFCHFGCPLGNLIPDFNDAVYKNDWKKAYDLLSETNNFPEFTGRICPAPCESSCVLEINADPVAIEYIEKSIIEMAFKEGWVGWKRPVRRTGKKVAIVGSGPAGLACADQLNKAGHWVYVYEKNDKVGGLLRYGIPDFKLEKSVLDRRVRLLQKEGIQFITKVNVGQDVTIEELSSSHDAVVLCGGAESPRDLPIEGRSLKGVHFAMEFLEQTNRQVAGIDCMEDERIAAKDKDVIVIGGGDTGADCIGTSNRLGAKSITQLEILEKPSLSRNKTNPWPIWPLTLRTSTSHEEGCARAWGIQTKSFISNDGVQVSGLKVVDVDWEKDQAGNFTTVEVQGSERVIPCDLVFLAIGFTGPAQKRMIQDLGIALDARGNIETNNYQTSIPGVFAAGDIRRGQSLVVWAINEGREVSSEVDRFLTGETSLLQESKKSVMSI